MMRILLLLFAAVLVQGHGHGGGDTCAYEKLTCEWKYAKFQWTGCPAGEEPKAHVFWGRDNGDNQTCVDDVPSDYLEKLDCPGNIQAASDAVTAWCNNPENINGEGQCKIKASNNMLGGDPCVYTFKYMRVCRYCAKPVCEYETLTCEWKTARFQWTGCPDGTKPRARVFWGRDAGDSQTCIDDVPPDYLQKLNCPGNIEAASQAVTDWCNDPSHVKADGRCKIRAKNVRLGGDPCVGTFKYMRVCRYCVGCESGTPKCDYHGADADLTCEWKYARLPWEPCPAGSKRVAYGEWGRETGNNVTCIDDVPGEYLQPPIDCPGNVEETSKAITEWCNSHPRKDGKCKIKASNNKLGGDPCKGTFKYLRSCTYCQCQPENRTCDVDDGPLTCEFKKLKLPWPECPNGFRRTARAEWGRDDGDNKTCTEGVPYHYLQKLNCPGDDDKVSTKLTEWCNNHPRKNGICKFRAKNNRLGGDPCKGTFKYLRSCTYCKPNYHGPHDQTLILIDCTGDLAAKVNEFLDEFVASTSTDSFWAMHKTDLHVIPFDTELHVDEEWWLDYGSYTSAIQLRKSDKRDMAGFKQTIINKPMMSTTNIGRALEMLDMYFDPSNVKTVIVVSDFTNDDNTPGMVVEAGNLIDAGYTVDGVLLDVDTKDAQAFASFISATEGTAQGQGQGPPPSPSKGP